MPRLSPFAFVTLVAVGAWTVAVGPGCGGKTDDPAPDSGACAPGDKKSIDCNSCVCEASGQWSCTKMGCADAGPDSGKCTPGESRKLDCNTCTCMSNGEWACTGLACIDSGTDGGGVDPRCPSSWAAATTGSHDALCPDISCAYPEGSCNCPAYCGGPAPGPDWMPTWTCTPKPPPRTDGCPDVEPTDGAACATEGKRCDYDRCCVYGYTCTKGTWKATGPMCPP